ncbi:MAG: putative peroxidase [Gaiellaceae bacterium]|nr:putative peroxidase [Gaiellaceae bacterium]
MASAFSKLLSSTAGALDRRFGWDRLPRPLGVVTLVGLRLRLREQNLYDTGAGSAVAAPNDGPYDRRRPDGSYNDLEAPAMGMIGARFGRNVPLEHTYPEPLPQLLEPNPRVVSRELLTRDEFVPATIVNVLAGAWLQFEVHDWFSHGKNVAEEPFLLELGDDDPWAERPMRIERTRSDPAPDRNGGAPTYVTTDSHWWDGSQIYGSEPAISAALRAGEGGRLRLDPDGHLPRDLDDKVDLTGVAGNFWLGLALLHTLFSREHNAIADRLAAEHPDWTDERLFDKARLINAALMAKIHTVEWTPAIIAHPTTKYAMRANWWGVLGKRLGKRSRNEVLGGIPGSPTDHHDVPYSLTEEFVAVYRMHPLLPDDFTFRSIATDEVLQERTFRELGALDVRTRLDEVGLVDSFYSLGIAHPGAITLHNYPRFLQELHTPDGRTVDLAATDVLRIRERGVPRYNDFRRLFHLKPAASFEELTDNPQWAEELRRVYGDVERVDLMVGLYAEPLPRGFGFSDTAFRVFILMASRRLKSDRFFTRDYNAETYTQTGLDWIDDTSMSDVLLRHYPELAPALDGVENAFAPWKRVSA